MVQPLTQMQPNGIRVIVAFYLYCLEKGVVPNAALPRSFFILKASFPKGQFFFSSRHKLKAISPNKISDWKKKFFYFRLPGQQVPHVWRVTCNVDVLGGWKITLMGFGVLDERPAKLSTLFSLDNLARARVYMDGIISFHGLILKFFFVMNLTYSGAVMWCGEKCR